MAGFTINQVALSGNLTRDPELRAAGSSNVCQLRIAVTERVKNGSTGEWEDRPNYFDVTVWSGLGEWLANNLAKGDQIAVSGRLHWREWQDKDGGKRQAVDVVADSVLPMPRGQRSGGGSGNGQHRGQPAAHAYDDDMPVGASAGPPVQSRMPGADDDIPF